MKKPMRVFLIWTWTALWAFTARADTVLDTALAAFQTSLPVPPPAAASADIQLTEATPTFLFVKEDDQLLQLVKVKVRNKTSRAIAVQLRIERPEGRSTETSLSLRPGLNQAVAKVPDLRQPAPLALVIIREGKELVRSNFAWQPARHWEVYVTQLSHFDWGYTGTQAEVMQARDRFLDQALELARRTADWPEDSRFRWTEEASYVVRHYLETHPEQAPALKELAQAGRFEVNAKLAHLCSSTAGEEELARELYYSFRDLKSSLAVDPVTAIHTDVPGLTWGDATVLAGAGVKYLLFHPNATYRGGAALKHSTMPHAYYWQGPDGSRLLLWRSFIAYHDAAYLIAGPGPTAKGLPAFLLEQEKQGYPFELLHLTRSGLDPKTKAVDNAPPRIEVCETIREWNRRFAYPRLISDTPVMFFRELERREGGKIPVYAGDQPDWWADGVLTNAEETKVSRELHHRLRELELWSSLAALSGPGFLYPDEKIRQAYLDNYMFDEHTWGYSLPFLPREEVLWKAKRGILLQGATTARELMPESLQALAGAVAGPGTWVVFNPLEWSRSGPVRLALRAEMKDEQGRLRVALNDLESGEILTGQIEENNAVFMVKDVPGLGYRTYRLAAAMETAAPAGDPALENSFFRLRFDPQRGGLRSMFDKRLGLELLDQTAEYALGQPVARRQGMADLYDRRIPARVEKIVVAPAGPVYTLVTVTYRWLSFPRTAITAEFKLYRDLPCLDLGVHLEHYHNGIGASKYVAFPFAVPDPTLALEVPFSMMRPGTDQLPDFADYYAVSNTVAIQSGRGFGLAWSSRDGPLVEFGQIRKRASFARPDRIGREQPAAPPSRPFIYSELMNNFQETNYHYQQHGSGAWSYRIYPDPAGLSHPTRSGWELSEPLVVQEGRGAASSSWPKAACLIEVSPESVRLVTMKRAEDGAGWILRLYESEGRAVQARVKLPLTPITRAALTDVSEHDLRELPVRDGVAALELSPFSVRTIRVFTEALPKPVK